MELSQEFIYYSQENRDRDAANKKEPELKLRNFDARRVSKSILNDILCEIHKVNHMRPAYAPRRVLKIKRMLPRQKEVFPEPIPERDLSAENELTPEKEAIPEKDPILEKELIPLEKPSSMTSLILWNVSKALEMKPCLNLKGSIRAAQQHLDAEERALCPVSAEQPEQQHLICALLAWQRLGHHDADSLYRFVEHKKNEISCAAKCVLKPNNTINVHQNHPAWNSVDGSFGSHTTGPIVKLPVETKVIMVLENKGSPGCCQGGKKLATKRSEKETLEKINVAFCLDKECTEKLAEVDTKTSELRTRAYRLARREAERVELLERAETAWKNLETGYLKRLALAEEKEDDTNKLIQKVVAERNDFKATCTTLAKGLKTRGEAVEKEQGNLTVLEQQVCRLASAKLRLSEEAAKGEADLVQEHWKAAQYDRDLKFKEEQAQRKLELLEHDAYLARALTCEAERAMRAELIGLREQNANVSKELMKQEEYNKKLKEEHDELRQEKAGLVEDLEGCKTICDQKMQGQLDELMRKKEKLLALQEKVLECRCKRPVDETVQVKRTPSLAALCACAPEDKFLESCSCTSLRGKILSNLLADLFGGLQTELAGAGSQMPCQLLKCLEDQHSWDRPSVTKTNLRNFFTKLLKSELDIAIASSIENYHARWVGESCADVAKMKPTLDDDLKEGWQLRAIERRAQKMANQLAEELFRERSAQVEQRAKDIVSSGPPPCECVPKPDDPSCCPTYPKPKPTAMFPCLMSLNSPFNPAPTTKTPAVNRQASETSPSAFWQQTIQDVTQLKLQIEDLKKDSIKKEDLKHMEENIFKLVREAPVKENEDPSTITSDTSKYYGKRIKKETKISRAVSRAESPKTSNEKKLEAARRDESPNTSNENKLVASRRDESLNTSNENKLGATRTDESPKTSNENKLGATRTDESPKTLNQNKIGGTWSDESPKILNKNKLEATRKDQSPKTSTEKKLGAARRDESPKPSYQNKIGATRRDESPKTSNENKLRAAKRDESPKTSYQNKIGATRRDESPKTSNENKLRAAKRDESPKTSYQNKIGATRRDESPKTSYQNKIGATRTDESPNTSNQNKIGGTWSDESPKISNQNKLGATRKDQSPKTSNEKKLGAVRRDNSPKTSNQNKFGKGSIYEKSTKKSKKQIRGQSYAVNLCLCGPQKNTKSLQDGHLNKSGRSSWKRKSLKDVIMPQSSIVKQTKPININLLSPELPENGSVTSEPCNSNSKCFRKMPSNTSIDRLLETLASWKYNLGPQEKCIKHIKSSLSKCSKSTIKEAMRILNQTDSKNDLSISPASNKKQNVNDIYEDAQMRTDKQDRSLLKQPATTESEYMGTVYLDKSHENNCKCITNIESNKENNQEKYEGGSSNIPFQYINTNICDCKIYQELQKDHKRSQTEEFLQIQSNQCQAVRSKDIPEFNKFNSKPKSSSYINIQKEIKQKSETSNGPQKTELFSISSEYFIKFLGVTLDDLSSNKKITRKLKTVDHNNMIPKDKHVERRRKLPKLSNIEQSNSLMKANDLTRDKNDQSKFNDLTKCECKAKFEEFTSFMNKFFDNKLHENTHKDEVIDSQNVRHTDNTDNIASCVCCDSVNVDDSRDLEVNAFHLLEDHIKEKLEEFRSISCKSKCIPREEDEKLFSTILQRVKQVISDCANKMKCGCPAGLPNKGSWNRAYGLLQEYLKIKIKRVQCLCVLKDKKDVILSEVLEEVCNLIENDFQRLKDICTCANGTEARTKIVAIGDHVLPPTELPGKDTNISQAEHTDVNVQTLSAVTQFSKQNSNNSIIPKENISSQVSSNLGMEAKSCDVMQPQSNKNARTTETNYITTDSKSNGVMYNTCDCCYNTDKVDIRKFPDLFGTKGVFVNLYAEQAINKSEFCDLPTIGKDQEPPKCLSAGGVESMKPIPKTGMSDNDENKLDAQNREVNRQTPRVPYIGCTVNCSCDDALGPCFCMKSIVQANNDKIESLWKGFLVNNNKNENFPYIMHGIQKKNSDILVNCHSVSMDVLTDEASTSVVLNNEDEMILKYSQENLNLINNAANTVAESMSLETAYSNSDSYPIDWNGNSLPVTSERSNVAKLANSIYFPGLPIDNDDNVFISGTATNPGTQKTCEICVCDKVPICHVKMLVQHIEKNLEESKCTCDSLISKVCPVHSKKII